ncbi:MAG: internalization-related competence protein ComEC/Rec2 [Cohnella sp.]|nr:internalization-related competence protein ComEC/Rec2 [Cohnella sp.]
MFIGLLRGKVTDLNRRPLVVFVCCWLIGASIPSLWQGYAQTLAVAGGLLLLLAAWISGKLRGRLAAACALALLLAFGERLAAQRGSHSELSALWELQGAPDAAEVSGVLTSKAEVDGDIATFRLAANRLKRSSSAGTKISEQVLVRVKLNERKEQAIAAGWRRGDAVRVSGTPEKPADAGNFGAFDYRRYMERQGIRWQWSVQGTQSVKLLDAALPLNTRPLRWIDELRSGIGHLMDRLYPGGDAGYMKGLVAGIVQEVDPGQYDAFSRLGLTHVLAISGLHVAVVVFLLLRIGAMLRLTRERSIDLAFAAMPVYMLLTGASPSAIRACLMSMIALALARRHRLKDGLHLLAASALLMTIWDPLVVEQVSFQLSFAVTAGLLWFTPIVTSLLQRIRFKVLREALAVGITAQVVSFPLSAYYFHGFHLLSLPANLVLVPFISFAVMPLGMASVALGGVWFPLGIFPAQLASYGNWLTFELVNRMNELEGLRTVWPQTSWLWVAAAYGLLGVTAWLLKHREARRLDEEWQSLSAQEETAPLGEPVSVPRRNTLMLAFGLILVLVWGGWFIWGYRPVWLDHDARVQFLDVGQGDSILIRTGQGKHILIDAGGTLTFRKPGDEWRQRRDPYEVGRKLLVPLLRQRGVRTLDALVLTHLDTDHIGGAEAVIRNIPVRAILWNGTWKESPTAERLLRLIQERGIPIYAARRGMKWTVDASANLDVLYPGGQDAVASLLPSLSQQNKHSVILLLHLYGRRFLLPGDVEAPGEAEVVQGMTGSSSGSPVDVLKAAHHGSITSTSPEWLRYWNPANVVISVGRHNLYGHPNPTVVARIEAAGIRMFRTDLDGEIQYRVRPDGTLFRRQKRLPEENLRP